ncbi:MAG TPA: hypothetical protein VE175_07010 [Woeseiaceae bacterium]|jgi:hypothetical protein|nr:hypothetical protein [Woeseiaceae bacterium]
MLNIVFGVGVMKTGTTYLQQTLWGNGDELRDKHWLYPGRRLNQQHNEDLGIQELLPDEHADAVRSLERHIADDLSRSGSHWVIWRCRRACNRRLG